MGRGRYRARHQHGGIPDRWQNYYPLGEQVAGTRFIAFKVPLKQELCKGLLQLDCFTPDHLLEQVPHLGLVVDLTNTSRYYSPEVFKRRGVLYQKVQCPGQVIPPKDIVHRFYHVVDQFLQENPHPESLIGVHCTHGLNRTAFFICSYMIERMGMPPQEALTAFQIARGHDVERQNYIETLFTLRPFSASGASEIEVVYPSRHQIGGKKMPFPAEAKQRLKFQKRNADDTSQGAFPPWYNTPNQSNGRHLKKPRFGGDVGGRNVNNGSYGQMFNNSSGAVGRGHVFTNEMHDGNSMGPRWVTGGYLTDQQGGILNSDGQGAAINAPGDGYRRKESVERYRNFGNTAWTLGDKPGSLERTPGNNRGSHGCRKRISDSPQGMPANLNRKGASRTNSFPESSRSRTLHVQYNSTAHWSPGDQANEGYRSLKLPS